MKDRIKKSDIKGLYKILSEIDSQVRELESDYIAHEKIKQLNKIKYEKIINDLENKQKTILQDPKNTVKKYFGLSHNLKESAWDKYWEINIEIGRVEKDLDALTLSNSSYNSGKVIKDKTIKELKKSKALCNERIVSLKKKEKDTHLKARIASHENASRGIALTVKKKLTQTSECPYCNKAIGNNPHADHIYPVSKGGQSIDYNMVMVCEKCNLSKGDLMLREFIAKEKLDSISIECRLEKLGKRF